MKYNFNININMNIYTDLPEFDIIHNYIENYNKDIKDYIKTIHNNNYQKDKETKIHNKINNKKLFYKK